jgi:ankyrin repeat protein
MSDHLPVVIELLVPNDSDGAISSILDKRKSFGGSNIDAKDAEGDTPLHLASRNGYLAIVMALRSGGADILAISNQRDLPIHHAVTYGNSEVVNDPSSPSA